MKDYTVKILEPEFNTVRVMSSMLLEDHVFKTLCGTWKSAIGLYVILNKIHTGLIRVVAAFDNDGKVIGVCYGFFDENRRWINHSAFLRGVNAVDITRDIEAIILINVPELHSFVGNIPETNRAALLYAKKLGYHNNGISQDYHYMDDDNNKVNCIEMIKIINEV